MKTKALVSLITALPFSVIFFFVLRLVDENLALPLAVCSGLGFYLLMMLVLTADGFVTAKRYAKAEKSISSPIWHRINGNIMTNRGVLNTNLYFTDAGIVIISLDRKPYQIEEIPREELSAILVDDKCRLLIRATGGRAYTVVTPEAKALIPLLQSRGWLPRDGGK